MLDELIDLTAAAATDIGIGEAAKRKSVVRVIRAIGGLLLLGLLIGVVYITVKYS